MLLVLVLLAVLHAACDSNEGLPIKFIVLTRQHSGSNFLRLQLAALRGVAVFPEVFLGDDKLAECVAAGIDFDHA